MKIKELLTEDTQLDEGPIGAVGRGIGNVIGGVARTAGAVKGAVKGAVQRAKSSFAAGEKDAVAALTGQPADDTAKADSTPAAAGTASAAQGQQPPAAQKPAGLGGVVQQFKKGMAQGKGQQPATATPAQQTAAPTPATGAAAPSTQPEQPAAAPAAPAADATPPAQKPAAPAAEKPAANDTQYAQAQKAIAALAPEQQKEILAALQADPKVKAAMSKPAVKKPAAKAVAAPAAAPAQPATATPPAAQPAAAPASAETPAVKKKAAKKKPAAPTQAEIDADRERIMGVTSDSIIRIGNNLSEALAKKIEEQKQLVK